MSQADEKTADWPGKALGLPDEGPRSVGRLGRRIGAFAIDWALATVVSLLVTRPAHWYDSDGWVTLGVFAVMQIVFLITLSGSIGHIALGMRVVPLHPVWIGVWRPVVRTLLLVVVIPAVIWDRDQRGIHDKLAGTVLVRR